MNSKVSLILSLHSIAAGSVAVSLYNNRWYKIYNNLGNKLLNLKKDNFESGSRQQLKIFKLWLTMIQLRYFTTDLLVLYNFINKNEMSEQLIKEYIKHHHIECFICFIYFFYKKKYTFSFVCLAWVFLWYYALS